MKDPEALRRWWFYVETWDDDVAPHLDENGDPVGADDIKDFIGTKAQADNEGERRADLFEEKSGALIDKIVLESRGKVKE